MTRRIQGTTKPPHRAKIYGGLFLKLTVQEAWMRKDAQAFSKFYNKRFLSGISQRRQTGPPRGGGGQGGNLPRAQTNEGPPKRGSEAGI